MYSVSKEYLSAIHQPGRVFASKVVVDKTGYPVVNLDDNNVVSIKLTESTVSGDDFEIGTACSSICEIEISNVDHSVDSAKFENAKIRPSIAIKLADGSMTEYCPLGIFTVDEITKTDTSIQIKCFDNMVLLEQLYHSSIAYPATLGAIAEEISSRAGVTLATKNFVNSDFSVQSQPDLTSVTLRQAISWIAQAAGSFARFNRDGQLEIAWYNNTDETITKDNFFSLTTNEQPSTPVDGIVIKSEDDDAGLSHGTCSNAYVITGNPLLVSNPGGAIVNIYNQMNGLSYMPFQSDWQGNIALMAGDIIILTDKNGTVYNSIITSNETDYDGGMKSTTQAVGKTDSAKNTDSGGNLSSTVNRVEKDQESVKDLLAGNITADNIAAGSITADKLKAKTITAESGVIDDAAINTAHIRDGAITTAKISDAAITSEKVENSAIKTAKIDDLAVTREKVADSAIGTAQIDDLSVNAAKIAHASIGTSQITDLAVTSEKVALSAIGTAQISDLAVTGEKVAVSAIGTAQIQDLSVTGAKVANAAIDTAQIKEGAITSAVIADAAIGSAKISDLSADKLSSGTINTANVDISGCNGRLKISGNRLQVFDGTDKVFERVSVGDVNGDGTEFGIRVRGADGSTELLNENGITKEGFSDGYGKVDDGSLDAKKIDIETVVTAINGSSSSIKGSKVSIDDSALDVSFSNLKQTVNDQNTSLLSQESQISQNAGMIATKVSQDVYDTDSTELKHQVSEINQNIDAISASVTSLQGGNNLILNSSGLNDLTYWAVSGNVSTGNELTGKLQANRYFALSSGASISQEVTTAIGLSYSISIKVKKTSTLQGYVTITDTNKTYTVMDDASSTFDWSCYSYTFTANSSSVKLIICNPDDTATQLYAADIMLVQSDKIQAWSPAVNEIYTENVKLDKTGIVVSNTGSETKTLITSDQFAIMHQGQDVISVNKGTTVLHAAEVTGNLQVGQLLFMVSPGKVDLAFLS